MKQHERSAYGRGIIAAKQGLTLEENPFKNSVIKYRDADGNNHTISKKELWEQGFKDYETDKWGNMKKHPLYEKGVINASSG